MYVLKFVRLLSITFVLHECLIVQNPLLISNIGRRGNLEFKQILQADGGGGGDDDDDDDFACGCPVAPTAIW